MTSDEQEALSLRYGPGVVIVVPLRSGHFGLFGADRQLRRVVSDVSGAELRELAAQIEAEPRPPSLVAMPSPRPTSTRLNVNLEDIGL